MNAKNLLLIIAIGGASLLPAPAQTITVLADDFADGVVDPDWVASTTNTTNPQYAEQDSALEITAIPPTQPGSNVWCSLTFTRSFPPVADFDASFEIGWDSLGVDSAMQNLFIRLYDTLGSSVAAAGYTDAWAIERGRVYADAGTSAVNTESLPLAGTSSIRIVRSSQRLTISFDGIEKLAAIVPNPVDRVELRFDHFTWSGGSTFGKFRLADLKIDGTLTTSAMIPHHAAELEWPGLIGTTYDLQASGDLVAWTTIETGIPGQNQLIYRLISTRALRERHGWGHVFFRHLAHPKP
jgi:hypothetical protein